MFELKESCNPQVLTTSLFIQWLLPSQFFVDHKRRWVCTKGAGCAISEKKNTRPLYGCNLGWDETPHGSFSLRFMRHRRVPVEGDASGKRHTKLLQAECWEHIATLGPNGSLFWWGKAKKAVKGFRSEVAVWQRKHWQNSRMKFSEYKRRSRKDAVCKKRLWLGSTVQTTERRGERSTGGLFCCRTVPKWDHKVHKILMKTTNWLIFDLDWPLSTCRDVPGIGLGPDAK